MTSKVLVLGMLLVGRAALADVVLSGDWAARFHEDQPERGPGPEIGDYTGLPINEQARRWAGSWDASRLTLKEHQCRVHTAPYIFRGPLALRIWEERDPQTQALIAIKMYVSTYEQLRTIWLDGREHPPAYMPHTWQGFSTGQWEGDMLTVSTTHLKQGWHRRNGLPQSDRATLIEHFARHDDYLTHITIVNDPIYLTEPLIKSQTFVSNADRSERQDWLWPCDYVEEVTGRPPGAVPHFLPGTNPFVGEFAIRHGLSAEAARGGARTMYPDYIE
jgi:hypothetical protein